MTTILLCAVVALIAAYLLVQRFPDATLRALLRVVRRTLGYRRRTVDVDGLHWCYIDSGGQSESDRRKPVMLLIHGYGADKHMWLGYGTLLKQRFRVIAPDLPGFGESTSDADLDYAPRTQAARLQRFCEAIGLDRVHAGGSSMGGFIGSWFAIDHPSLVETLTLMNAAGVMGEGASTVQDAAEAGRNPLIATTREELDGVLQLLAYRLPYIPGFVRASLLREYQRRLLVWNRIFWRLVETQLSGELEAALPGLLAPTLIIWGAQDRIIDVSCAAVFAQRIPRQRVVVFDMVGHVPMFEVPRETATAQLNWIDEVDG